MSTRNRRTFLRTAALAFAAPAFGQEALAPRLRFPKDPRARLAVATYPFRSMIIAPGNRDLAKGAAGMKLGDFARFIVKEFRVPGIEPLHSHFPSIEERDVAELKKSFDDVGVFTCNIPVDEQTDLCNVDPAVRHRGYEIYRRWIDIAVQLASPSIRINMPACANTSDVTSMAAALEPILSYAASRNIIINLENDDPILANDKRIVSLIESVRSPYLRALPDFANSLMGGDESFNAQAVRNMFRFASNIAHVKDAEVINGSRRSVQLADLFAIAKSARYEGFYSMESDSNADPVLDTRHLIEQSLSLL